MGLLWPDRDDHTETATSSWNFGGSTHTVEIIETDGTSYKATEWSAPAAAAAAHEAHDLGQR